MFFSSASELLSREAEVVARVQLIAFVKSVGVEVVASAE